MMIVRKVHEAPVGSASTPTRPRSARWGIFVGGWAPTFFGPCPALAQYEDRA
ncbi:hypothetical protein BX266_7179 [Streptomyces sp. TLI_171]|nr:hypothetical protein BX266_7179 [Streptomyces sp. TLI_171]